MIEIKDMISFDDFKPGRNVKLMLLYFQEINKYYIHDNKSSDADGEFIFMINGVNQCYFASHWIRLEKESEIPF